VAVGGEMLVDQVAIPTKRQMVMAIVIKVATAAVVKVGMVMLEMELEVVAEVAASTVARKGKFFLLSHVPYADFHVVTKRLIALTHASQEDASTVVKKGKYKFIFAYITFLIQCYSVFAFLLSASCTHVSSSSILANQHSLSSPLLA
jgi:hypothetical protein